MSEWRDKSRPTAEGRYWFLTLEDARKKLEDWRRDYNEIRPHSSIGDKPPIALINRDDASSRSSQLKPEKSTFR